MLSGQRENLRKDLLVLAFEAEDLQALGLVGELGPPSELGPARVPGLFFGEVEGLA